MNPNGCPIKMTYFTTTQYTNYSLATGSSLLWLVIQKFPLLTPVHQTGTLQAMKLQITRMSLDSPNILMIDLTCGEG